MFCVLCFVFFFLCISLLHLVSGFVGMCKGRFDDNFQSEVENELFVDEPEYMNVYSLKKRQHLVYHPTCDFLRCYKE